MTKEEQTELSKDKDNPLLSESDKSVLQLHQAEYQVLMGRNTAAMQWSWAMVPLGLGFLGLVANAWNLMDHRLLAWGAAAGVQAAIVTAIYIAWDHYNNTLYVETELHERVADLLLKGSAATQTTVFWDYESYQVRRRRNHSVWWEWLQVASAPILVAVVAVTRIPFSLLDWCGLGGNLLLLALLIYKTLDMKRIRIKWSEALEARHKASPL